jgi:hypothetical protein
MRKLLALALLVAFSWIGGLGQDARAGVTIDVVFQNATSPSGITINAGDPGSSGWCGGGYPYVPSPGYCMDVILTTTLSLIAGSARVGYDSDNGLSVLRFNEWRGVGVQFDPKSGAALKSCTPVDGVTDSGSEIGEFDCGIASPNAPPSVAPGTYQIGTIVWDTSGTSVGTEGINVLITGAGAVINGNIIDYTGMVVAGSHILNIVPEPGTASLLGLGLVGLVLTSRRRRG